MAVDPRPLSHLDRLTMSRQVRTERYRKLQARRAMDEVAREIATRVNVERIVAQTLHASSDVTRARLEKAIQQVVHEAVERGWEVLR